MLGCDAPAVNISYCLPIEGGAIKYPCYAVPFVNVMMTISNTVCSVIMKASSLALGSPSTSFCRGGRYMSSTAPKNLSVGVVPSYKRGS